MYDWRGLFVGMITERNKKSFDVSTSVDKLSGGLSFHHFTSEAGLVSTSVSLRYNELM